MRCPICRAEAGRDQRFCIACGAALTIVCPACGGSNPPGVRICRECGAEPGAGAAAPTDAERRHLTLLFCDLAGSALLSRLDPEDLRALVGAYHRCCDRVIGAAGGFVAKYMGDGVLAYFGYPRAQEDDAEQAVRAALELVDAVAVLRAPERLRARIGIATGLVVVGDLIGQGAAQEHAVVGQTPNLAARLRELANPGEVVIAEATRRLAGGLFEYRDMGPIALKGLPGPVTVYKVLGPGVVRSRFAARHEGRVPPMVGRAEELDLLLRCWEQAKAGSGRAVLVCGEAGIGKSRLKAALLEATKNTPHRRLRFVCRPHHEASAFHPIIGFFQHAAGFTRNDTPEEKLGKLKEYLRYSDATNDELELIAELLSLPHAGRDRLAALNPQRRREKIFEALLAQGDRLGAHGPVLMIWEDVHWIDPTSLEVLKMRVERIATRSALVVISARPGFTPPWREQPHIITLELGRLGRPEAAELVRYVTGGKALPPEIMAEILVRSDGVPLFVEEVTKVVLESGLLKEEADGYTASPLVARLAIPATLHDSLAARLDRLAQWREVVQVGAALGREFSYELLRTTTGLSDARLQQALGELVRAELVFCRGTSPEAAYTFKHALLQDAAYATMLRDRRRELHARIVATLEAKFRDIVAAQPERLGQHCVAAGLLEKGIKYWLTASRLALTRSTTEEAIALLRKALALLPQVIDHACRGRLELDLQVALGQALSAAKGYADSEADHAYARALELCEQLGRPRQFVPVLYGQFLLRYHRLDLEWIRKHGEEACRLGEAADDPALQWLGSRMCGTRLAGLGELAEARVQLERCLTLSEAVDRESGGVLPPEGPRVGVLFQLCRVLCCLGYLDQARTRMDEMMTEARQRPLVASYLALSGACFVDWCLRTTEAASLDRADQLMAVSIEQGFAQGRVWAVLFRGRSLLAMGHPAEAIALLRSGLSDYYALGISAGVPMFLTSLAEAYRTAGQPEAGLEQIGEAVRVAEATQNRWPMPEALRIRAILLQTMGNRGAAEKSLNEALALARRQHAKLWELRAAINLAALWRAQGKRIEAQKLLAPVVDWFSEGWQEADLRRATEMLSQDMVSQ